jgi:hypothetical protein
MGASIRDVFLPLLVDSQGFYMYVAYYFMLLVLLFGVGASVVILGMGRLILHNVGVSTKGVYESKRG